MISYIVKKSAAVYTGSLLIIIVGVLSYLGLPKEAAPEIEQPYIFVTTLYPGVAAKDVENLVTRHIENEIDGLEGLDEVTSTSQQSLSFIFATFTSNVSVETALRRVRERVDIAKAKLPADAEEPVVQEFSSSNWPILIIALSHPDGIAVIDQAAEKVREEVQRVKGVLDVEIAGQLEREIAIELDPAKLEHYGMSIDDVTFSVQAANVAIPGGILQNKAKNYTISVNAEIRDASLFEEIIVKSGPVQVPLRELGTVRFDFAEPKTYSRFNGAPCVTLSVTKRSGENIIQIVDNAKKVIEDLKPSLPPGTRVDYTSDDSRYIRQVVADLENNMFTGFILVLLVTVFFLGWVNSLFVSLAIPFSMLLSFFVLDMLGITLNMVVLFSLILALGMLVDNGIVIVENIFRHGSMGKSQVQAAIDGAREVAAPVISSTVTTCLAFFPIMYMPDIMGDFMSYVPKTVIVVLTCSLLVALTINPVFCSRYLRITDENRRKMSEGSGLFGRIQRWYVARVEYSIRHSGLVLTLSFVVVFAGMVLYFMFGKEQIFFPATDPINGIVTMELPQGTPVARTDSILRVVEHITATVPASLDNTQSTSGRSGEEGFSATGDEYNKAFVRLAFAPYVERKTKAKVTLDSLKSALRDLTGAEAKVESQEMGPPSGYPVSYEIVGDDYAIMGNIADRVLAVLEPNTEFKLVDTDYEPAKPELVITVDRQKAAYHGLSVQAVAGTIRNAINGSTIGTYRQGEDEYDIVIRYKDESRNKIESLGEVQVVDKDGNRFALSELATIKQGSAVGVVKRRNLRRAVGVWADFGDDVQNKNEVKAKVDKTVYAMALPPGYRIVPGSGLEMRQEAMEFLVRAFMVAVFLIAMVLVGQFNSIVQPVIIVTSVFLSMGGVFWGYLLTGQSFVVIMSGVGVIALAGVAVNNCIVLVDYTNILIRSGMYWRDAVVEAGRTRLRPVLLTAITTVLGLLPMALGVSIDVHPSTLGIQIGSESSEFWKAFAWAMIYGLSFATVMTLVMVPCMLAVSYRFFPPKTAKPEGETGGE